VPDVRAGARQLVFFGYFDWDVSWMQFHRELMHELAALGWHVLWVGPPLSIRRDGWITWCRHAFGGELTEDGHCRQFRPWTLPGRRFDRVVPLWSAIQILSLRKVMNRLGLRRPAVMLIAPPELALARGVPHGASLYWIADEVTLPGEAALVEWVDRILVVSDPSWERHADRHAHKMLRFTNGVPFRRYGDALASSYVPADLRGLRRPIVGYVGSVSATRVDLDVFPEQARRFPGLSVVVVGAMDEAAQAYFDAVRLPNLHVLGPRPYAEMPHYVKYFDVALIPYRLTAFNLACNPLKLYEYLALGKAVVSTPLPAVRAFGEDVWIAATADDTTRAIAAALADNAPERVARRIAIAREHDTERLARELAAVVEAL
jgi:glycosyltransferase involved in cell wall biosynthesis